MLRMHFLVIPLLLIKTLSAETPSTPEDEAVTDESYSNDRLYCNRKLPVDQDMHFPDPDGGKMTRTSKGATWKGKKGGFDVTVSVEDAGPHFKIRAKWGENKSTDDSE